LLRLVTLPWSLLVFTGLPFIERNSPNNFSWFSNRFGRDLLSADSCLLGGALLSADSCLLGGALLSADSCLFGGALLFLLDGAAATDSCLMFANGLLMS